MTQRLVQISDLHFGALREATVEPLLAAIADLCPALVVVSGDLTQRATETQFRQAREFLERIPCAERLVVPGNHDISLYNLWRRFFRPLERFDRHITAERFPTWRQDDVAVMGINTARSWAIANGRVNRGQLVAIHRYFESLPAHLLRVVVCHHPFALPDEIPPTERVGRADMAMASFVEKEVDLLLTGHRHIPWVSPLGTHVPTVHAGTTTSERTRKVPNSFNEIVVEVGEVTVFQHDWDEEACDFRRNDLATHRYPREPSGRLRSR